MKPIRTRMQAPRKESIMDGRSQLGSDRSQLRVGTSQFRVWIKALGVRSHLGAQQGEKETMKSGESSNRAGEWIGRALTHGGSKSSSGRGGREGGGEREEERGNWREVHSCEGKMKRTRGRGRAGERRTRASLQRRGGRDVPVSGPFSQASTKPLWIAGTNSGGMLLPES